jgi:hypothetical protein
MAAQDGDDDGVELGLATGEGVGRVRGRVVDKGAIDVEVDLVLVGVGGQGVDVALVVSLVVGAIDADAEQQRPGGAAQAVVDEAVWGAGEGRKSMRVAGTAGGGNARWLIVGHVGHGVRGVDAVDGYGGVVQARAIRTERRTRTQAYPGVPRQY